MVQTGPLKDQRDLMDTITIDLETTGLDPEQDKIVCFGYKLNNEDTKVLFDKVPNEIINLMESPKVLKIGHNIKFDISFIRKNGVNICGPYFDTMIACFQQNPFRNSLKLKDILKQEFMVPTVLLKDLLWKVVEIDKINKKGKIKKVLKKVGINVQELDRGILENYNKQDIDGTYKLYLKYKDISDWTYNVENPLIDITIALEKYGLYLNQKGISLLEESFREEAGQIRSKFYGINLNSPLQIRDMMTAKGIDTGVKTAHKKMSTSVLALKQIRNEFSIAKEILRFRLLDKLLNTYINSFKNLVVLRGGFNQCGTSTGRYSSSKPNMQNIPARSKEGQEIRRCIIPRPGYKFVIADLSQIEPRLFAYYSNDPILKNIFANNLDFHTEVTRTIYHKQDVTKDERFVGKTVGLATLYQAGSEKLKETLMRYDLDVPIEEVENIRSSIHNRFPVAVKWSRDYNNSICKKGFITTLGGCKINVKYQELNPTNYLIQRSCAEIMKLILLNLYDNGFRLLSTIHDEVIVEEKEELVESKINDIKWIMENSVKLLNIPIIAECRIADSWTK